MEYSYKVRSSELFQPLNLAHTNICKRLSDPLIKLTYIDKTAIWCAHAILFGAIFGLIISDFVINETDDYSSSIHVVTFILGLIFICLAFSHDLLVHNTFIPIPDEQYPFTLNLQIIYRTNLFFGWILYLFVLVYFIFIYLNYFAVASFQALACGIIQEMRMLHYIMGFWWDFLNNYDYLVEKYIILHSRIDSLTPYLATKMQQERKMYLIHIGLITFLHILILIDLILASALLTNSEFF